MLTNVIYVFLKNNVISDVIGLFLWQIPRTMHGLAVIDTDKKVWECMFLLNDLPVQNALSLVPTNARQINKQTDRLVLGKEHC